MIIEIKCRDGYTPGRANLDWEMDHPMEIMEATMPQNFDTEARIDNTLEFCTESAWRLWVARLRRRDPEAFEHETETEVMERLCPLVKVGSALVDLNDICWHRASRILQFVSLEHRKSQVIISDEDVRLLKDHIDKRMIVAVPQYCLFCRSIALTDGIHLPVREVIKEDGEKILDHHDNDVTKEWRNYDKAVEVKLKETPLYPAPARMGEANP